MSELFQKRTVKRGSLYYGLWYKVLYASSLDLEVFSYRCYFQMGLFHGLLIITYVKIISIVSLQVLCEAEAVLKQTIISKILFYSETLANCWFGLAWHGSLLFIYFCCLDLQFVFKLGD